ncbi:class II aldolase/adducin family protein [Jannaschia sp. Os4]|uniref:class II aldolase/adducin family protein n=1 Tax=Jannaschia sp. Os4 TaxID=2807617 RepID=UPI001EED7563|nr:class II aldolase/adducin family protein [Jannaschia sp. Os4]
MKDTLAADMTEAEIAEARRDLAATLRWAAREELHEAVANHFSLAVDAAGRRFLMNPNQRHFARVRASDLLLIDADDPATMDRPDAPDPTAWGLHGAIHRAVPHARCVMHLHPPYATVLASLQDSRLPAIDQNTAIFHDRVVIDEGYGGMAFEAEGARCAALLADPRHKTMVMGSHGVLTLGDTVADCWNRMWYLERACRTYVMALQTGRPIRRLSDAVAEQVARETEDYPGQADRFLSEIRAILGAEGSDYAD